MLISGRSVRVGAAVLAGASLLWSLWNLGSGLVGGYASDAQRAGDLVFLALSAVGAVGAYVGLRREGTFTPPHRWFVVMVVVVGMMAGLLNARTEVAQSRRTAAYGLPYPWLHQAMAREAPMDELAADWQIAPNGFFADLLGWTVAGYGLAALASRPETDDWRYRGAGV